MTIQWTGFPSAVDILSDDILVGLNGGTANARFNANSLLLKASNLSDVASSSTARANLGLGSASNVAFLNVFAGASGAAGVIRSYSSSATTGYIGLTGIANSGDYAVIISNASHAQSSTISIPDGGQATENFIISDSAGTQHIETGGLQIDGGSLLSGLAAGGTAGSLTLYPSTTANGFFKLLSVNAGAAFNTTVSNSVMGQSSVISIPDPGSSTANFLLNNSGGIQTIATGSLGLTLGYLRGSNANALTAFAGGGQGSALQLARQINRITTVASAGDSVKLPAALAGMQVTVINAAAANAMDCFPLSGEVINALPADTALSIVANKTVIFLCAVNGTWNSVLTA